MKKLVKGALLVAVAAFAMTACNKEKAAVNKLEGTWTFSNSSSDVELETCGAPTGDDPMVTWAFTAYDVPDASMGTVVATQDTFPSVTLDYMVSEDGKTLTIGSGSAATAFTINKLTKSDLEIEITETVDNITDCNTYETEEVSVTTTSMWTKN